MAALDKVLNAGGGALKSLLITVPTTLILGDKVPNKAAVIGTGAAIGAGTSLAKDYYQDADRYIDSRRRFRDVQNTILAENNALLFTSPNTGKQKALVSGVHGLFSEDDSVELRNARALEKIQAQKEASRDAFHQHTKDINAQNAANVKSMHEKLSNPSTRPSAATGGNVKQAWYKRAGNKVLDTAKTGEFFKNPDSSTFVGGMEVGVNSLVRSGQGMALNAVENLTRKSPTAYALTHRQAAGFSELDNLPEEYDRYLSQIERADDRKLELDRVLDFIPVEDRPMFVELVNQRCNFEGNDSPEPVSLTPCLDALCEAKDFSFASGMKAIGRFAINTAKNAVSGVTKGLSKAADAVHLNGAAAKLADTSFKAKQSALNSTVKAAQNARATAVNAGKDAAEISKLTKRAQDAQKVASEHFNAPKRSEFATGKGFKSAVEEANKNKYVDDKYKSIGSKTVGGILNKVAGLDLKGEDIGKAGAEMIYGGQQVAKKAVKAVNTVVAAKTVKDTVAPKAANANENQNN